MRSFFLCFTLLSLPVGGSLSGCDDETARPVADAGGARDAGGDRSDSGSVDSGHASDSGTAIDSGNRSDSGGPDGDAAMATDADSPGMDAGAIGEDGGPVDGGGMMRDACVDLCPKPRPGCYFADPCDCSSQVCVGCARDSAACNPAEFCDFGSGCGMASGTGTCEPRPMSCPRDLMPVCGCDGVDYDNECLAHRAGTDVDHDGPCAPADCRTTGCASTESCEPCRTVSGTVAHVCLPMGVVC